MSRKTVPILMATIAVLFIALVAIIALLLGAPDRRMARRSRRDAISALFSPGGALNNVAASIASPYSQGGSLDNLEHFLSKDPGRREFPGVADRRRMENYVGAVSSSVEKYENLYRERERDLSTNFLATTRALFDQAQRDILNLTGMPPEMMALSVSVDTLESSGDQIRTALAEFANFWIPNGETHASYSIDRQEVRDYLIESRRFSQAMSRLDNSWRNLSANLYNLSNNPAWMTAVSLEPELARELQELTIIVLSSDIYWRSQDVLISVPDRSRAPGAAMSPGIIWTPEMSFYKNIPELTGHTLDEEPTIFFAKVNLGYTFRDSRTQTWLNRRKDWLSDYFLSFFSNTVSDDFSPVGETDRTKIVWATARLKAEGIHPVNRKISLDHEFGVRNVYGVRELALVRVNLLGNP